MVAVHGQSDGHRKRARTSEESPNQQFPELKPLVAPDAERVQRPEKGRQNGEIGFDPESGRAIFAQKGLDSRVIGGGGIKVLEQGPIAGPQSLDAHPRLNVGRVNHVIAGGVAQQTAFLLHALIEAGSNRGLKKPHHGRRNAALLNEFPLPAKDGRRIVVESDNESGFDMKPGPLKTADALEEVTPGILPFVGFGQTLLARRFDADEDVEEAGKDETSQQFLVVRQIDGDLGAEGVLRMPLAPNGERLEKLEGGPAMADQVVVHEKDAPAPLQGRETIELRDHLGNTFETRGPPQEGRDVAEIAIKGAAPGELNGHGSIPTKIREFPERDGRALQRRITLGPVEPVGGAFLKVGHEGRNGQFPFIQNEVVHLRKVVGGLREERAAGHDAFAGRFPAGDKSAGRRLLNGHGADQDNIGPLKIGVGKIGHIQIHQPFWPFGGEKGRGREEA